MTLFEQLETIIAALDAAQIEYALVGGLAVAVWGAPRATQDIDLLVRPESVDAIITAIEPLGFRFRALPITFSDGMRLQRVSKIEDGALLTLDLTALIQMKAAAGRPQDAADIVKLEELDR